MTCEAISPLRRRMIEDMTIRVDVSLLMGRGTVSLFG